MGCCVSKNCPSKPPTLPPPQSASVAAVCSATPPQALQVPDPINKTPQANKENDATKKFVKEKQAEVEESNKNVKREIFVIEHRRSHEKRKSFDQKARNLPVLADGFGSVSASNETAAEVCDTTPTESVTTSTNNNNDACLNSSVRVRTSSFTKEEVDAILIQCGKLSRSNSINKATPSSGRKRRANSENNDDCCDDEEKSHRRRQTRSGSQERRRRTPSREREQQGRSNSRERVSSSGRRVSRSPGKRNGHAAQVSCNASCSSNDTNGKPGKMVSVPATVTSIVADRGNSVSDGLENANNAAIKRIQVKRNASEAGGPRGGASPRTMSPARANNKASCENQARAISPARGHYKASCENQARAMSPARGQSKVGGENQARGAASPRAKSPARGNQQQPLLNRSSSRKERSPYRRNPLGEIDQNSLLHPQMLGNKNAHNRRQNRSRDFDEDVHIKESANNPNQPKPNVEMNKERASYKSKDTMDSCTVSKNSIEKEHQQSTEDAARQSPLTVDNTTTSAAYGAESLKPQTLRRSRSSRQSRDLDINPETLEKPTSSYTALLLEDIQNFHQKSNNNGVSVPPCVLKACSIVEAVDDLTSTTNPSVEPFVF